MSQNTAAIKVPKTDLDPATQEGLDELIAKLSPLLQGRRLHNIVDLLSLVSDTIDMADDAMVQKLMKNMDEAVGSAWTVGNAARYAAAQTAHSTPPSLLALAKKARDEDVRRGLNFAMTFLSVLGRQMKNDDVA